MADITIKFRLDQPVDEARDSVAHLLESELGSDSRSTVEWVDQDRAAFKGYGASASLVLTEKDMASTLGLLEVKLSFALRLAKGAIRGKIESMIRSIDGVILES